MGPPHLEWIDSLNKTLHNITTSSLLSLSHIISSINITRRHYHTKDHHCWVEIPRHYQKMNRQWSSGSDV